MDRFFDYFQIAGLVFFLSIFAGRTLYLWIGKKPVMPYAQSIS